MDTTCFWIIIYFLYFHKEYDNPTINDKDSMNSSLLGQEYTNEETKNILEKIGAKYKYYDITELNDRVVNYISEEKLLVGSKVRLSLGLERLEIAL